jgi:hypothetical protein
VNSGLWGVSALLDLTYTFKGWQQHDGTNCARLEFSGTFRPNISQRTNQPPARRVVTTINSPNVEVGKITGRSWYEPEIALAVETVYEQDITTKSTSTRRPRPRTNTNNPVTLDASALTNAPPPPTNSPAQTVTTTTKTTQQTIIKLVAIETLEKK